MLIQWFQVDPLDAGVLFDPVPEGGDTAVHGRPESVTISGHPRKHTDLNHVPITEAEQWTARITLVKLGITCHHEECYQWSISQTTDIIISASRNQFTCAYNSKYPLIQSCHKFEHATTSAVVTCAKLWLGQIIILHAIATRFLHEVNWRSNFTWITVARLNDSILEICPIRHKYAPHSLTPHLHCKPLCHGRSYPWRTHGSSWRSLPSNTHTPPGSRCSTLLGGADRKHNRPLQLMGSINLSISSVGIKWKQLFV